MIPEAIEELRAGAADPFPKSFNDYATKQLTGLRDRLAKAPAGPWTWGGVLDSFALLSIAKAPLPPEALRKLVNVKARLDELDPRAERWLWRRTEEEAGLVSFAHPRLAAVFGAVLPNFEVDREATEERLIEACATAWKAKQDPLKAYALAWLPAHLIAQNRADEAAQLLGDAGFPRGSSDGEPNHSHDTSRSIGNNQSRSKRWSASVQH